MCGITIRAHTENPAVVERAPRRPAPRWRKHEMAELFHHIHRLDLTSDDCTRLGLRSPDAPMTEYEPDYTASLFFLGVGNAGRHV